MSLWEELRRRNVFRVAAAYLILSWLLIQVAALIAPMMSLPDAAPRFVLFLLIILFPVALLFAWAFDLTPEGIKRTQYADAGNRGLVGSKLDYALIGGLVIVAAVTLWGQLPSASVNDLTQPSEFAYAPSIAVLPFADLSPDGDLEYYGDGIAEELLNELTRLDGLRVAGRTSSFSFKQTDADLQTIGETLDVYSILDGSIRKDGDRIRINAQLINAADGSVIWSELYNRELTGIFAIQEEIAVSVAGALGVRLGVGGVNAFKGAGTQNVEAYEAYLQSASLSGQAAMSLLERAIQLDENYAAAWASLGLSVLTAVWTTLPEEAPEILERAYSFVLRAVELDPDSAVANSLLATVRYASLDWIGGEEAHAKALSLLSDRDTLSQHANLLMRAGRSASARTQYDAGESAEPLDGRPNSLRLQVSLAQGRFAEANEIAEWEERELERMEARLHIALNEGDPEAIKMALSALPPLAISTSALYSPVLSEFDSPDLVLSTLRAVDAEESVQWPSKYRDIALLAAYFGDPRFALQVIAKDVRNIAVRLFALWYPVMSEVRRLPEFKELVTDINLVEYWRAYGWADACRPLGDDDFECS